MPALNIASDLQAERSDDEILEICNTEVGRSESKFTVFTSREAWTKTNPKTGWVSKLTGLPALRICVLCCLLFSLIGLVVCSYVYTGTVATRRLRSFLMEPYENIKNGQDIGIISELVSKTEMIRSKLEALSSWANGSGCISGSGLLYTDNICYRLVTNEMTYHLAEEYCSQRGGHVAFINDEEELEAILIYLWSLGYDYRSELWVGLTKVSESEWKYSNGQTASYLPWAKGNLFDEGFNCAQLRTEPDGKAGFYDRRCSDSRTALCKYLVR